MGNPDGATPQHIVGKLCEAARNPKNHRYSASKGITQLRNAICEWYSRRYDVILDPEIEAVVTIGSKEGLSHLVLAIVGPGDIVLTPTPAYPIHPYSVIIAGGQTRNIPIGPGIDFFMEMENAFKSSWPRPKMLIINFPHNPTGAFLAREELFKIVEIAKNNDIYLFSDEMYHLLTLSNTKEIPCVCDIYEKGISLWGMAKTFGLAGLRIGWLACQNTELLKKVVFYKDYLTICNSAPSEILSLIAINHKKDFITPNLIKIQKNINLLDKFRSKHTDFIDFILPKAGSTCFAKLNIPESTLEFCRKLVENTGVMMVPSEIFEYGSGYIRVGFGRKYFPEVLEILHSYIKKNYNK